MPHLLLCTTEWATHGIDHPVSPCQACANAPLPTLRGPRLSAPQTADVGVGIMGKEGRQAVNNSDYAIAQFRRAAGLGGGCMADPLFSSCCKYAPFWLG